MRPKGLKEEKSNAKGWKLPIGALTRMTLEMPSTEHQTFLLFLFSFPLFLLAVCLFGFDRPRSRLGLGVESASGVEEWIVFAGVRNERQIPCQT